MIETTGDLKFVLSWLPGSNGVDLETTANLSVRIGSRTIWPVDGGDEISLEIQADDLLSHLTEFWKPLILRQTYPIPTQPDRPSHLRLEAEKLWATAPEEAFEGDDALVAAFEEAHDLSRCFAGMFDLPPLWLVRQGERMLVETRSALRTVAFQQARDALQAVGDEIASHLCATGTERWGDLLSAWRSRNRGEPAALLAWASSLDRAVAQIFANEGVLEAPRDVADAANDTDELRIAARMASALPAEQIREIISLVQGFEQREAPALKQLVAKVQGLATLSFANLRPFEQGEAAANFVRAELRSTTAELVDVFRVVETLGVSVRVESVEPPTLSALAVWGPRHGPSVLLNGAALQQTGGVRSNWHARVTCAHELCHLLVDQGHTLTAVEVLHSRMPLDVERRAKAFAGEFLLPGRIAAELWREAKSPRSLRELEIFVAELCRKFGVTKNVAAWKLDHGLRKIDVNLSVLLGAVAPNR